MTAPVADTRKRLNWAWNNVPKASPDRTTVGIALAVAFAAALGLWIQFSPHEANSTAADAAKASIVPIDIMRKVGKDLRDETPSEPF